MEFLGKLCVVIALLGIFISVIVIATYDGGTKNKLTEPERLLENEYSLVGSFCNMYIIATDGAARIWWDKNTDVLYYRYCNGYKGSLTAIMDADGTPLTLTEWKERQNYKVY